MRPIDAVGTALSYRASHTNRTLQGPTAATLAVSSGRLKNYGVRSIKQGFLGEIHSSVETVVIAGLDWLTVLVLSATVTRRSASHRNVPR